MACAVVQQWNKEWHFWNSDAPVRLRLLIWFDFVAAASIRSIPLIQFSESARRAAMIAERNSSPFVLPSPESASTMRRAPPLSSAINGSLAAPETAARASNARASATDSSPPPGELEGGPPPKRQALADRAAAAGAHAMTRASLITNDDVGHGHIGLDSGNTLLPDDDTIMDLDDVSIQPDGAIVDAAAAVFDSASANVGTARRSPPSLVGAVAQDHQDGPASGHTRVDGLPAGSSSSRSQCGRKRKLLDTLPPPENRYPAPRTYGEATIIFNTPENTHRTIALWCRHRENCRLSNQSLPARHAPSRHGAAAPPLAAQRCMGGATRK